MTKKIIEFKKEKLESLKYSGKIGWYIVENFEELCVRVLKNKKTYYTHWSISKIKNGKVVRVRVKRKISYLSQPIF